MQRVLKIIIGVLIIGFALTLLKTLWGLESLDDYQDANSSQSRVTTAEPVLTNPTRSFEFRGLNLGSGLDHAKAAKIIEDCLDGGGYLFCRLTKREIGEVPIWQSYVDFKNDKFDGIMVDVNSDWYDRLIVNLRSAYGEPCRTDSRELQNAFGATFSGDEVTWCFRDGEMVVRRHNKDDVRKSGLVFSKLEAVTPKKTFSTNSI